MCKPIRRADGSSSCSATRPAVPALVRWRGRVPVSRQAVTQHLAILEDCRLITRRRRGREVLFSVEPDELIAAASWLTDRAGAWRDSLATLKREAEADAES